MLPPEHPLMQQLQRPAANPAATLMKLQHLAGILKQLGHPAFQGPHLPGLPTGMQPPSV